VKGDLKAETETEIVAAQDQALQTSCNNILQTQKNSKCRVCHQFEETVDHISSECSILAKEQYIKRHDKECALNYTSIYSETCLRKTRLRKFPA
jgi:hypothetical protein